VPYPRVIKGLANVVKECNNAKNCIKPGVREYGPTSSSSVSNQTKKPIGKTEAT
jgi:hypothetical protein